MLRIGRVLPARIGASEPDISSRAGRDAARREDVAALAVGVAQQGQVARCGSDRIPAARPSPGSRPCRGGSRRCGTGACGAPPRWRTVMWPRLLRPEPRFLDSVSAEIGRPLCSVGLTTLTIARRPGEVGFSFTTGIYLVSAKLISWPAFRLTYALRTLRLRPDALGEALRLAGDVDHVDRVHVDLEEGLDRSLHFSLGGVLQHAERVLVVLLADHGALLRDDRSQQHLHHAIGGGSAVWFHPSISWTCDSAVRVIRTFP